MSRLMIGGPIKGAADAPLAGRVSREGGTCIGRQPAQGSEGYSVLQMVVTFAVIGVLASFALPTTVNPLRNYRLTAAVAAATGAISAARYLAIMRGYPYQHTLTPATNSYQVYNEVPSATTYSAVGTAVPISRPGDVSIIDSCINNVLY